MQHLAKAGVPKLFGTKKEMLHKLCFQEMKFASMCSSMWNIISILKQTNIQITYIISDRVEAVKSKCSLDTMDFLNDLTYDLEFLLSKT